MIRPTVVALMAAAMVALPGADSPPAYRTADGAVRIVGYNDMDRMLAAITARVARRHAGLRFGLVLKSTRSAPAALIADATLFAPMGAELTPADRAAFRLAWGSDPVEVRIAHDSLDPAALSSPSGVLVARDCPLRSITVTQARRIFAPHAGDTRITRWGELGIAPATWRDRAIHAVTLAPDTAIGAYLLRRFDAPGLAAGVTVARQSRDVAARVASDSSAIGIANLNLTGGPVRALTLIDDTGVPHRPDRAEIRSGRYPFDRFLLAYVRRGFGGAIDPLAREVLAEALSDAGQRIVAAAPRRYIALNPRERAEERAKLGINY